MRYKRYSCRYYRGSESGRQFFSIPLVWHRVTRKSWPLGSTKTQTHVLLITDVSGRAHIVASPMVASRGNPYKGHAKRWERFCDDLYACWWCYLPCALPPRSPYKKRYAEAELAKGYTRWKVHPSAVMDDHRDPLGTTL